MSEFVELDDGLFDWADGEPSFRGFPVERRRIAVGDMEIELAGLKDAADLLDDPECARRFIEEDIAPYGMELWPSASMLAAHILAGESGRGRHALELGCGLGLIAIAATKQGWRVTATDNEPMSLRFAAHNARRNGVSVAEFSALDWHEPPRGRRFTRIFGADLLYQKTDHVPILACLDVLLSEEGIALLADPNRGVADGFESTAGEVGFASTIIEASCTDDRGRRAHGRIFELRRSLPTGDA